LLVRPGGSKLWRWRYVVDGKEKLMALGEYPLIGLSHVREQHRSERKNWLAESIRWPIGSCVRGPRVGRLISGRYSHPLLSIGVLQDVLGVVEILWRS